jgi:hypothetical protein
MSCSGNATSNTFSNPHLQTSSAVAATNTIIMHTAPTVAINIDEIAVVGKNPPSSLPVSVKFISKKIGKKKKNILNNFLNFHLEKISKKKLFAMNIKKYISPFSAIVVDRKVSTSSPLPVSIKFSSKKMEE